MNHGKDSLALIWHDLIQARLSLDGQLIREAHEKLAHCNAGQCSLLVLCRLHGSAGMRKQSCIDQAVILALKKLRQT